MPLDVQLFPIGRFRRSEGLMLFTHGELANRLAHPRYEHDEEYGVLVTGSPNAEALRKWRRGMHLEDGKTLPVRVTPIEEDKHTTWLRITMKEGRKRRIPSHRLGLGSPGAQHSVSNEIGPVQLGQLKPQEWRRFSREGIERQLHKGLRYRNAASRKEERKKMEPEPTLGCYIGLGAMGKPMALNLSKGTIRCWFTIAVAPRWMNC